MVGYGLGTVAQSDDLIQKPTMKAELLQPPKPVEIKRLSSLANHGRIFSISIFGPPTLRGSLKHCLENSLREKTYTDVFLSLGDSVVHYPVIVNNEDARTFEHLVTMRKYTYTPIDSLVAEIDRELPDYRVSIGKLRHVPAIRVKHPAYQVTEENVRTEMTPAINYNPSEFHNTTFMIDCTWGREEELDRLFRPIMLAEVSDLRQVDITELRQQISKFGYTAEEITLAVREITIR